MSQPLTFKATIVLHNLCINCGYNRVNKKQKSREIHFHSEKKSLFHWNQTTKECGLTLQKFSTCLSFHHKNQMISKAQEIK